MGWREDWFDPWLDLVLGGACVACGRAGRLVCPPCREALPAGAVAVRPDPCPEGLVDAFAATEYADPVRRMILLHKERQVFGLARVLGSLLAAPVAAAAPSGVRTVLVPVPSRAAVVRARGHDPMLRVSRAAAACLRTLGTEVSVVPVLRQRDVVADQAGLGAAERAANLADRIATRAGALRALARGRGPVAAVVCDDVLTTGATAREAQRALEDVGLGVAGIACVAATRRRLPSGRPPLPVSGGGG